MAVLASVLGLGNTAAALTDAYRERYPTFDGYLFIGIATQVPFAIGAVGIFTQILRRASSFWLWTAGTYVVILPGLLVWSFYASIPTPRTHMGAGQMHIFFLPFIHIGYCFVVYLVTGLLALFVSRDSTEMTGTIDV